MLATCTKTTLRFHTASEALANTIVEDAVRSMARRLHNVIFVLGPPGSGKGTSCLKIQENLGFVHLSAGDLLRAEREREGSQYGRMIEEHITNGTIVPVEVTCKLLENAMEASGDAPGFLIDGFPRNQNNLEGWKEQMEGKARVNFVLFLSCPTEICVSRCLGRGQGRSDDNEESLRKRVVTYNTQTLPVIDHYREDGLVREVSSAPEPEQVFEQIVEVFQAAGFNRIK